MNILIDRLPTTVIIDDTEYKINTDFRIGILFEQLIEDEDIKNQDRFYLILNLFYPTIPSNVEEAFNKIKWFYSGGKEETKKSSNNVKVYDFECDAEYIYSAFMEQYRIDLQDIELHWWKFIALFKSLKEDTEMVKIMGYRSINLNDIEDKKQKDYYRKMQRIYKLPTKKDKETLELEKALLEGKIT